MNEIKMNFNAAIFLFLNQMDSPVLFDDTYLEECPTTSSTPVKEKLTFKRKKFNVSGCYNTEANFSKQQVNNLPVDGNDVFNMFFKLQTQCVLRMKDSVCDVLRHPYTDEFLALCNWDGRGDKQPLSKFLLSNILYAKFCTYVHINLKRCILN
ncbi:uncharacterized protein LOC125775582 [Bactrocera dorsalis]|uniref:Uncharacterized protein LOC125775582 n=1 Tax=Bactrocera dorsalis TaxID=27457 RepID=A0ABM3IYY1_BACDO|nr:uncharacterized protein LOC125775582 [Bactrocera dorsalis]